MRLHTLYAHLGVTEDALRNERIRLAGQLELVRKLRAEGRDCSPAEEALRSMKASLSALERHRERLREQIGRFAPSPPVRPDRHSGGDAG